MPKIYLKNIQNLEKKLKNLNQRSVKISFLRFIFVFIFLISIYFYTKNFAFFLMLFSGISFVYLVIQHQKINNKEKFNKILLQINITELNYLEKNDLHPFKNGENFKEKFHLYAEDLDLFGRDSLFQHLNRTATFLAEKNLAERLKKIDCAENILKNQIAIKELSEKIDFRQHIYAHGKWISEEAQNEEKIEIWLNKKIFSLPKIILYAIKIFPIFLFVFLIIWFFTNQTIFLKFSFFLIGINLIIFLFYYKKINQTLFLSEKMPEIFLQYSEILTLITKENFEAEILKNLQNKVKNSEHIIKKLSKILANLTSIENIFGAILINSLALFHLHIFKQLNSWRQNYAKDIFSYLKVIAEFEVLNSLANFAHHHPEFSYPKLNASFEISLENMAHPLLKSKKIVKNSLNFKQGELIILTGSNMSGKSTFLRALGINIVLTSLGLPICAEHGNLHPLPLCTSMRISDNLSDGTSYFMAEILRLKQIMHNLDQQISLVLLDEILRGTNAEDQRQGTILVLQKMLAKKSLCMLTTHDLEICNLSEKKLKNYHFSSEITENQVIFDYQLKTGICQSKTAQFLLKREGVV